MGAARICLWMGWLLALVVYLPGPAGAAEIAQVDVFESGKEGYHTFRIPSLVVSNEGTLLAFCEGRKSSRADLGNNDMMLKRSTDGGRTWGPLQMVYEEGDETVGNPTAVVDRKTGTIWLALVRNARDVLLTHSGDDGKTWAEPREITDEVKRPEWGFYAVGPGLGIQLVHGPRAGRLLIPAYHRETADKSGTSSAHVFYSDDGGRSWRLGGSVGPHTNEPQAVETLEDGEPGVLINARNHWGRSGKRPELAGKRIVARSTDGGESWSKPEFDETLIEPTCQASILRYSWAGDGERSRILFSNPAAKGRRNMTVRLSYDEGRTWPVARAVYEGSSAYCCLARLPDGRVGLVYERDDYGKITFAAFGLDWLTAGREEP